MEVFGQFDFGLTESEEDRARRLHGESVIVDMLFQGPCGYRSFSESMTQELRDAWEADRDLTNGWNRAYDLPARWALAGRNGDFERCWRDSGITAGTRERDIVSVTELVRGAAVAQAQFDRFPWLVKALDPDDIVRAKELGLVAGFVNSQDTIGFGQDLSLVECAYDLGLRMVQLTYNAQNLVGCGCKESNDSGVSSFGSKLIGCLNRLGVIVDTSHCGRRTTLDACALSDAPVIASHTSAAALYDVPRAKSDEELEAIAATGGVIGAYAVPDFLSPEPSPTIEAMLDHIDYLVALLGVEHVGVGTDWPLQMPKWGLRQIAARWSAVHGLRNQVGVRHDVNLMGFDDYRDFPNITRGLVKRGYDDRAIGLILGQNFLRVFRTVREIA
jgi:membrane dipeptidase